MLIFEDQDKLTIGACELLAAEGFRAVISSGKVVYFVDEKQEGKSNGSTKSVSK